jgi:hypothetical protein
VCVLVCAARARTHARTHAHARLLHPTPEVPSLLAPATGCNDGSMCAADTAAGNRH